MHARRARLSNGLKLVAVEMPHVHSVSLVAYVKAGSRYESDETNGLSHFLEHMFFRGTERFPSTFDLAHRIESLGGTFNATTSRDMAYYFTELPPRHLEAGLEVLADMFRAPLFPDVEIEREVVLEEMSEDYNEDGVLIDPDSIAKQKVWPKHALGFPIIGLARNVKRVSAADLRAHHRRLYTAPNMVLAAAGNVSLERLRTLAREHLAFLPDGPEAQPTSPLVAPGTFHWIRNPDNQLAVDLVFPGFREGSEEWKSAVLLRRILDDGISSRLHRAIVDRGGIAYGCEAILDGFHDVGTFEFECSLAPEKLPTLLGVLARILRDLKDNGPEEHELEKAKERFACDLEFAQDNVGEMSGWYGGVSLYREPETLENALAKIRRVSAADVRAVARRLFDATRAHLVVVGEPGAKDMEGAKRALGTL
ncbi:MAG TPA: pitrilysin family protein [bacterium]|nr:pitrilysin family protein [bacterium]